MRGPQRPLQHLPDPDVNTISPPHGGNHRFSPVTQPLSLDLLGQWGALVGRIPSVVFTWFTGSSRIFATLNGGCAGRPVPGPLPCCGSPVPSSLLGGQRCITESVCGSPVPSSLLDGQRCITESVCGLSRSFIPARRAAVHHRVGVWAGIAAET